MSTHAAQLVRTDRFADRHIGPSEHEIQSMLETLGFSSLDDLSRATVPADIRLDRDLELPAAVSEKEVLEELRAMVSKNEVRRSFIGLGYNGTVTPPVIQRNILENPGWYTQYTPYQAEISQGRLEALFNFQTMISELAGLEVANSSLLDEGTAAAEAMSMALRVNRKNKSSRFLVADDCHPQTIAVIQTRAEPLGMDVEVSSVAEFDLESPYAGVVLSYPTTDGRIEDYRDLAERAHAANALVIVTADLLALTLLVPPGEWGADVVVGNTQRFGVPFGFGGPHAAYMATRDEYKRQVPGRIVGQTIDATGAPALRLALQSREQHIRRERATSNICTAQVLLAIMAGMYGTYHGPEGLRAIASRVRDYTVILARGLERLGYEPLEGPVFDTLRIEVGDKRDDILTACDQAGINLRRYDDGALGVSLDETVEVADLEALLGAFAGTSNLGFGIEDLAQDPIDDLPAHLARTSDFMQQEVFHLYHSETEFLRYVHRLQGRDLSLTTSMIPLGSCTMKLNATTEMLPVTWPEINNIHPFAPAAQTAGYRDMFASLQSMLSEITGMSATSLQPNAGSQGEYAGMLVIRAFHEANGESHRDVCLIPESAHGTNPASAVMAGMKVVVVKSADNGDVDLEDLRAKAEANAQNLAAIMVTYPSTHGVFERGIREICSIVHDFGGQVYLDGANMNAQVGLCRPGDFGADVVHLNLHKTFCIPHGGGGPGMGPICVQAHLAPHLPGHPLTEGVGGASAIGPVSAAAWGSPSILPISWTYIRMLGPEGLKRATQVAILNANYMAKRIGEHYDVLFRGPEGQVAHEFIVDTRGFKTSAGIEVVDIAKRLMDYGFHAPTMSWPVAGTMMIEPTESEAKYELDRLCDALISIRKEIEAVENGDLPQDDNPLKHAPHIMADVIADEWAHAYTREVAAFPSDSARAHKFWPTVRRVDDAYGDRNLVCTCPPIEAYAAE